MNLELWHDLFGIHEVQKNIVKSAQPLVQLFDSVLVAQNERKMSQPSEILPVVGNATVLPSWAMPPFLPP